MTDNLRIWNAVSKTDPNHTKKVNFGRTFTSIDAHWQIQQATKQFGPVGEGWRYEVEHSVVRLSDEMVLAVADVKILWRGSDDVPRFYGPIRATCEMWSKNEKKGRMEVDEDAPKKAMTDALTKGLSHLGFSADVFLGLFDDNRYVQKIAKEFQNGGAGVAAAAANSLEEAHREIEQQTGNGASTYTINKASAAKKWADAAIEALNFAQTREDLDLWKTDNEKALSKLEANHPEQHDRIMVAMDNAYSAVKARAA